MLLLFVTASWLLESQAVLRGPEEGIKNTKGGEAIRAWAVWVMLAISNLTPSGA